MSNMILDVLDAHEFGAGTMFSMSIRFCANKSFRALVHRSPLECGSPPRSTLIPDDARRWLMGS
jgi:hypothetical protein